MQISWFTVVAEALNFLLLVWLLKRFLYKPVLAAIDAREKKITGELEDAKNKIADAEKKRDAFAKNQAAFDAERSNLLDAARADAGRQRDQLLQTAQKQAEEVRTSMENAWNQTQAAEQAQLMEKTQTQVMAISRQALAAMASVRLEEQTVSVFLRQLLASPGEEKSKFVQAFGSSELPIVVQSAFDLAAAQQTELEAAVDQTLGRKTTLQFKTTPELISGIEFTNNGYKLAWSLSEYLNSLEKKISDPLKQTPSPVKK